MGMIQLSAILLLRGDAWEPVEFFSEDHRRSEAGAK